MLRVQNVLWAGLLAGLVLGCGNDCDFHEACDGNTLLRCGEGPDQMVGREIHRFPCESPTPLCIEIDDESARCVVEPATICDESYNQHCKGSVLYFCSPQLYSTPVTYPTRYIIAQDCGYVYGKSKCIGEGAAAFCQQ